MALRRQVTSRLGELLFLFLLRLFFAEGLQQPDQFTLARKLLLQPGEQPEALVRISCRKQISCFGQSLVFTLFGFSVAGGFEQPRRLWINGEILFQLGEDGDAICEGCEVSRLLASSSF